MEVPKARADNADAVAAELDALKPSHVFMMAGRTHGEEGGKNYPTIDFLELPGKLQLNLNDNLVAPVALGLLCKSRNIHLTYMGTGCIFSYDDAHSMGNGRGFEEGDKPNFFGSAYSTVKGATDMLMHLLDDSVLNLRLRMPITGKAGPRNFITKIVGYEKICSIPNSMSCLDELLPVALQMAGERRTGTVNFTNPGAIEHNEVLAMYRDIVDPSFKWKNFTEEQQAEILACGRSNNLMTTPTMEKYGVKPIREAVKDALHVMAAEKQQQGKGPKSKL